MLDADERNNANVMTRGITPPYPPMKGIMHKLSIYQSVTDKDTKISYALYPVTDKIKNDFQDNRRQAFENEKPAA